MSDFLGRLAARALGQVPPVRPRLPSRFEPAAGLVEEVVEASPVSAPPRLSRPSPRSVGEREAERPGAVLALPQRDDEETL